MFDATTILAYKSSDGKAVIGGDGQVTFGNTVLKNNATKIRKVGAKNEVLAGFAGSTADAFNLFDMFENHLENSKGDLLSDEDRLTKFGQFLRSTSLDELPELYNVVKGEMNLVGPRPLLIEYLPLYNNRQARRHEILPGITGWAQVNGRNEISWEDRLEMDVWYVENQSLWLDMKILFLTVFKVFKRDGINQAGHATMPYFSGTKTKTNDD